MIEIGCMAHARRKFHDLYANYRSDIAEEALEVLRGPLRNRARSSRAETRQRGPPTTAPTTGKADRRGTAAVADPPARPGPDGSATAKAIEYSLGRWAALIRYLEDGDLPIDNNHIENRIRPVALGRSNWLFAGSLACRPARRRYHEPDPVRKTQRPRSVSLPQRRPGAPTDPARQPTRGTAAASMATQLKCLGTTAYMKLTTGYVCAVCGKPVQPGRHRGGWRHSNEGRSDHRVRPQLREDYLKSQSDPAPKDPR